MWIVYLIEIIGSFFLLNMYIHISWIIILLFHSFFKHDYIYFNITHLRTSHQFQVFWCCWCIWMHKTLFRTWQNYFHLLRIKYHIQILCCQRKLLFIIWVKYPMYNYTHCMIDIANCVRQLYQCDFLMSLIMSKLPFLFHCVML